MFLLLLLLSLWWTPHLPSFLKRKKSGILFGCCGNLVVMVTWLLWQLVCYGDLVAMVALLLGNRLDCRVGGFFARWASQLSRCLRLDSWAVWPGGLPRLPGGLLVAAGWAACSAPAVSELAPGSSTPMASCGWLCCGELVWSSWTRWPPWRRRSLTWDVSGASLVFHMFHKNSFFSHHQVHVIFIIITFS